MSKREIETTGTSVVYKNRWMTVREDTIIRSDGSPGIYGVVEKQDFVVIAAVREQSITLVEQHRYPVGRRFWELPQGAWEGQGVDSASAPRFRFSQKRSKLTPLPPNLKFQAARLEIGRRKHWIRVVCVPTAISSQGEWHEKEDSDGGLYPDRDGAGDLSRIHDLHQLSR